MKLSLEERKILRRRLALLKATMAFDENKVYGFAMDYRFDPQHFANAMNGVSLMKMDI